ncbi:MAG: AbrB/MazE/SpoVT family DNA-binding domain-containing protein [Lachnospiraceae bacterium]|jgi:antitoxin component of MazEF toxin-antitoxin module|nr:AbrB/MazE/SpoVT family DNA-binding domain-containing protein [Lachnospiraceae bacterium]
MMQVAIKKWGNSQGIILSKELMELLNAHIGDSLDAAFENGNLILKKQKMHKTLEERIAESGTPLTFGEEIDWGESRGTELW